jgi:mannose-6-phosphate isomerase-like protein (cupin superfamily)
MVFILRGTLHYFVGEQQFQLRAGDCLWHHSTEPHRWTNEGRADAVSLHVNTPPVW